MYRYPGKIAISSLSEWVMSSINVNDKINDISAFIIAGGKSRRFGSDKLMHNYLGKPLISHVADILTAIFKDVAIIADGGDRFSFLGLPWYPDIVTGAGPIAGILTALEHSKNERCFITAGDMPGLNEALIRYITDVAEGFDVTVPVVRGEYETLHAVYSRRCTGPVKRVIEAGNRRIVRFFHEVRVREIREDEISTIVPPEKVFHNINYPGDIEPRL